MILGLGAVTKGNSDFFLRLLFKNERALLGSGLSCVLLTNTANAATATMRSELSELSTTIGGYAAEDALYANWSIVGATGDSVATYIIRL
jgi:hypothetical protein